MDRKMGQIKTKGFSVKCLKAGIGILFFALFLCVVSEKTLPVKALGGAAKFNALVEKGFNYGAKKIQEGAPKVMNYGKEVGKNIVQGNAQYHTASNVMNGGSDLGVKQTVNASADVLTTYLPNTGKDTRWGLFSNIYNNSMQNDYNRSSLNLLRNSAANNNTLSAFAVGESTKATNALGWGSNITQAVLDNKNVQNYANENTDSVGFHTVLDIPDALATSADQVGYDTANWVDKSLFTDRPDSYYGNGKNPVDGAIRQTGDAACIPIEGTIRTFENGKNAMDKINESIENESKVNTDPNSKGYMQTDRLSLLANAKDPDDFWRAINPFSDPKKSDTLNSKSKVKQSNAEISKKPNIYLYGAAGQELTVRFDAPWLLAAADPDYPVSGWNVILDGNGRLTVKGSSDIGIDSDLSGEVYYLKGNYGLGGDQPAGDGTLGYLFYESKAVLDLFQNDSAWVIAADEENRRTELYKLMAEYGFNEAEATDFADFWDDFLKQDTDYLFYPQLTETIDRQMPVTVTPTPEHTFRLWFVVEEKKDESESINLSTPEITQKAVHEGLSLTEWGIVFRSEEELMACPGAVR